MQVATTLSNDAEAERRSEFAPQLMCTVRRKISELRHRRACRATAQWCLPYVATSRRTSETAGVATQDTAVITAESTDVSPTVDTATHDGVNNDARRASQNRAPAVRNPACTTCARRGATKWGAGRSARSLLASRREDRGSRRSTAPRPSGDRPVGAKPVVPASRAALATPEAEE